MPANSPAFFPSLPGFINNFIGEEDEDFGDFMFSFPSTILSTDNSNEEEWGDFIASHHRSQSLHPQSSSPSSINPWVKPMGAIPLSVFGEEEEDEIDPAENGFGSFSFENCSSSRPAMDGKLNDVIGRLYGQVDGGGEEEGSWEFVDAMSGDARPKIEEGGGAVFGLEMVTAANENGRSQVVVNRLENGCKNIEHLNLDGQERGSADVVAAHELTNRSLGHNHSVTDKAVHEMLPSFENQISRSGTNGFKIEFPENSITNGFTEKIQDDQAELLHPLEKQEDAKVVGWNMLDFDDPSISPYANGKKDLDGNSEDHIEHNTGAGKMDYSPVALTSIIQNLYEKTDSSRATLASQNSINNGQEIDQLEKSSAYVNGDMDFDQFNWVFQNAVETEEDEKLGTYGSGEGQANESTSYTLVDDLYCRLKEESLSFIVHHLAVLKVPALPGSTPQVKKINQEIQEAYGNLQEMISSEDACTDKQIASRINQLINVTRTSNFKAVEQECHLSERLLSAEKHLNASVDLFEHSSSFLQTLRLTSREHQLFYINAWSKLASACAAELQLGAKIWTESCHGNVSKQILNKGTKYFLALGEIYRVSKILKATVLFYKPWLLANLEDSNVIDTFLEKGDDAWIISGLEEALQRISSNMDLDDKGLAKPLLESIKLIDKVNEPTFQDTSFQHKNGFCRFSLLPFAKLPGIKTVIWNGDCYIAKVANFWANRISPDPPELPTVNIAEQMFQSLKVF